MVEAASSILIVEDEALIAISLASDLEELGYSAIEIAYSVPEALQLLASTPIWLALVDLHLKGVVATPLLEELRARGIPFILCSGSGSGELPVAFRTCPALDKPYAFEALRPAIAEALRVT